MFENSSLDFLGMPASNPNPSNSVSGMANPDQTQNSGFISSLEGYATDFFGGVKDVASGTVSVVEQGLEKTYQAGKTVVGDVVGGVEGVVSFGTTQVVILVGVVAVGLYLIAKTGAVKAVLSN